MPTVLEVRKESPLHWRRSGDVKCIVTSPPLTHLPRGEHCMRISRLWPRVPVLLSMCLLSWAFLSTHAQHNADMQKENEKQSHRQHNQQRASVSTNMPYGISVVNLIDASRVGQLFDTSNPTLNAYTNTNTSGGTFRTSWADVEPENGKFDFSKIDTVLANAERNGKWVRLILVPGFGTPAWAMQGVQSDTFSIQYGPGAGTPKRLPIPWDSVYNRAVRACT